MDTVSNHWPAMNRDSRSRPVLHKANFFININCLDIHATRLEPQCVYVRIANRPVREPLQRFAAVPFALMLAPDRDAELRAAKVLVDGMYG